MDDWEDRFRASLSGRPHECLAFELDLELYGARPDGFMVAAAQDVANFQTAAVASIMRRVTERLTSPLEKAMAAALVVAGTREYDSAFVVHTGFRPEHWRPLDAGQPLESHDDVLSLQMWMQRKVGRYTADFYLTAPAREWVAGGRDYVSVRRAAVVECDGHDYHERTKEQARHDRKRDRFMQQQGLLVFRYPGSEIWQDPIGCALDAVRGVRLAAEEDARSKAQTLSEKGGG